ncbi:LPXTG cell wall anchor domain-containing protein [Neobacillus sp. PS3-34]|uniref:LPXTG cell wall anchor domain-containing protein n=1 Tax=Neobacillus sp. PS3-34 TaxID=3070678 RepID=UPI0027E1F51F|nr:LPXTG cell wall anchor domain-containing protein [Neobacillus sp. PS3-34]WML46568.1 LPXTG cell wall anchor domain-containing protein [Neobacillus sp. PS3-34]
MTENQTHSGTKGWYFSMLPKTGDSSPIGYYLAGLFIILAGAVMLRAKKVKSE